MSDKTLVELFRYVRPKQFNADALKVEFSPHGGISFLFMINQVREELTYYYTICQDDENFSYELGRKILTGRRNKYGSDGASQVYHQLSDDPGVNSFVFYRRDISLVQNVKLSLEHCACSDTDLTLLQRLKKIEADGIALETYRNKLITSVLKRYANMVITEIK